MTNTMNDLIRRRQQDRFVGRREEQTIFSSAVQKLLQLHRAELSSDEALFDHVFLLYGDGGMGKTELLRRFEELCRKLANDSIIVFED